MRILIAESNLQLLAQMRHALGEAGYSVLGASDVWLALGFLTGPAPPNLLVTGLPLGSGSQPGTVLSMRAQAQRPRIPVLYVPATSELAKFANPDHGAVLIKPFAASEFVATVSRLLERRPGTITGRRQEDAEGALSCSVNSDNDDGAIRPAVR